MLLISMNNLSTNNESLENLGNKDSPIDYSDPMIDPLVEYI